MDHSSHRGIFTRSLKPSLREVLITLGALGFCAALAVLKIPCAFQTLLGIPCPACGMTRAWLAAFRLDFSAAFGFHPMFWSLPILWVYILRLCDVFRCRLLNWSLLGVLLLGYGVNYIFVLAAYFRPV